ncbi:hypothetical protein V2O64_16230 [Verrucomicrobiaceae bacterium 227]
MNIIPKALLTILGSLSLLQAEVQPVNLVLDDTTTAYNVPLGKTLIIENLVWALESDYTSQTLYMKVSGSSDSFYLKFNTENPDSWAPVRPMRLVGGGQVRILKTEAADWRNVLIMGLLVDDEDLYAANIDTKLKNPREVGNTLVADVKYSSPRPRITKVQSGDENMTFTRDETATVAATSSKKADLVSVKKNGKDTQFVRVAAVARSKE